MDDRFEDLGRRLTLRQQLIEKHSKDDEIYDFYAQNFHREICTMPSDTHNSVGPSLLSFTCRGSLTTSMASLSATAPTI